jgi:hypothetical protein
MDDVSSAQSDAPAKAPIREQDLVGFKYFKKIQPLLARLHDDGCARDKAHNRHLHYDQHATLLLLFFFNPIVTSMRGLVEASKLEKVRKKLGVLPTSLGSFSEAGSVFDADLMQGIVAELGAELKPIKHDSRLDQAPGILTLVDGTVVSALAKLVGHLGDGKDGADNRDIKLHTHFELLKGVPADMDLTKATDSEVENLRKNLLPGRVYVKDRGYGCFRLFQEIIDIGSHFVCRIRDNSVIEVIENRPLSDEAKAAGILSDQIVWLGCQSKRGELRQKLRILKIKCTPHRKRIHNGRDGPEQGEFLLIATDLLDLPAEVIGLIYKSRWTVEIFFRFFKHILGCRHLLSHRENGIKIQVYMAIIACMLITLWSGRKPTLRTVEMLQFYFTGWATEAELDAHIEKLKKQDE